MNILDILLGIRQPRDPTEQILAQSLESGGVPAGGATGTAAPQPPAQPQPPPKGVDTPVTQPAPEPTPTSLQSPPDLANMYLKLMERNRNAARLDSGLTTIAAGFAQEENRPALLRMAENAATGKAGDLSMTDIIKLKEYQDEQAAAAAQASQLGALGAQYKLDPATLQYLNSTGQLGDVIKELATPSNEVVEAADGSKILINKDNGQLVRTLSPGKPRDTEYITMGDGSKVLVFKDDKTPVAGGKPVTDIAAPEEKKNTVTDANGVPHLIGEKSGKDYGVVGESKDPGTIEVTRADGSKFLARKDTGDLVKELSPADPTKGLTDDQKEYAAYVKSQIERGLEPTPWDVWLDERTKLRSPTGSKNWDPGTKTELPDPPTDMVWKRDKNGAVLRDADGDPIASPVAGSKLETERIEKETKKESAEVSKTAAADEQVGDIDEAIKIMDEEGDYAVAGPAGSIIGNLPIVGPYTPQGRLNTKLTDITSRISLQELQRLVQESPRGASGLGQVTNYEQQLLARIHGSIRQGMHPADLRKNLNRYKKFIQEIVKGEITPDSEVARDIETNLATPDAETDEKTAVDKYVEPD